eukprot:TRINITY_DN13395_c0_g1_i1.p1 TRINITY_DN13395_c0_g1~~TRINITY_DN13395_c0_g1_i1.p1  ORF type:complete len:281 (-),score=47.68 TRINITY_DN13395_c0_g1_i1:133-975(-)
MVRCCCCPSKSGDEELSSDTEDSDSDSVDGADRRTTSQWWEERDFDSMYFPPGLLKQGFRRIPTRLSQDIVGGDDEIVMSNSLMTMATGLPAPGSPENAPPCYTEFLPGVTLQSVYMALGQEDWPFQKNFEEDLRGAEFSTSAWQAGVRVPNTEIRGVKFTMPVPEDIPSIARRFLTIPERVDVRTAFRMRLEGEELHVVQQLMTSDVPFSDYYRVQSAYVFSAASGGVNFRKWVECVWVKEPPGYLQPVKGFIAKKVLAKGTDGARTLAGIFKEDCSAT